METFETIKLHPEAIFSNILEIYSSGRHVKILILEFNQRKRMNAQLNIESTRRSITGQMSTVSKLLGTNRMVKWKVDYIPKKNLLTIIPIRPFFKKIFLFTFSSESFYLKLWLLVDSIASCPFV